MRVINDQPKPTAAQLETIAKLEADAARSRQAAEDSCQRCDTDGFLSQWASGMTAQLRDAEAEILSHGGCAQFTVLIESATGRVVSRDKRYFPHFTMPWLDVSWWKLPADVADRIGRHWIPTGRTSRVQKSLGLEEALEWAPAYAKLITPPGAKSTGLGGCANAYVGTFRKEESRS